MTLIGAIHYCAETIPFYIEYQQFIVFPFGICQLDITRVTFPVATATSPLSARIIRPGGGAFTLT